MMASYHGYKHFRTGYSGRDESVRPSSFSGQWPDASLLLVLRWICLDISIHLCASTSLSLPVFIRIWWTAVELGTVILTGRIAVLPGLFQPTLVASKWGFSPISSKTAVTSAGSCSSSSSFSPNTIRFLLLLLLCSHTLHNLLQDVTVADRTKRTCTVLLYSCTAVALSSLKLNENALN